MGYSTIIDIIGSTIVGGLLMLILFRTNSSAVENTYNYGSDLSAQQRLAVISKIIDYDFSKIGYCKNQVTDYTGAIKYADSTQIQFYTDMNDDGIRDSVTYKLGPTSDLSRTPNPSDRIIYRTVYDTTFPQIDPLAGVTVFKMIYYDTSGTLMSFPISNTSIIRKIKILLKTETSAPFNGVYASAFLEDTKYVAYNINRR